MKQPRITIAHGDGIGPEIMAATLSILEAAQANLTYDTIEIGEKVYNRGLNAGIEETSWEKLVANKIFLKAPITTPQGGGFKSLNVTVRKALGLYANVRPCNSYSPFVRTKHPKMDLVIVRENEEDLYAGIEHRQTDEVFQCLKLITRPGCEKIVRYAFEYALRAGRSKVSCFTKDNIMKMTDGLFHKVFDEIGAEYPSLEKEHLIVDIGAAKLADTPEIFDVVVMPNLYGDILSDVAAQIAGSVGLAGSSNIGETCAMFEAIHGSAPLIAGKDLANPSGLILASVQMLGHMGQGKVAEKIHNAWLKTIEDGIHTQEIFQEGLSKKKVGTKDFAISVGNRLGEEPTRFPAVRYGDQAPLDLKYKSTSKPSAKKELVGVDVFVQENNRNPNALAERLSYASKSLPIELTMITNRGVKVYPKGMKETFCTDHWRCRFVTKGGRVSKPEIPWSLLRDLNNAGIDVIKTENLYLFDGERATHLGKDNKHPFSGESVYFATKHSKETALSPLLSKLGLSCVRADVDTDRFGTFSGEVERVGGVRETLRLKTVAAAKVNPDARFVLASEGSFGPHPLIGFVQSDHEALLFVDRKQRTEIYVEEISTETNHSEIEFGPRDDLHGFLEKIGFPEHGIIVKPKGNSEIVFKNLQTFHAVGQAIIDAFLLSTEPKVILSTDMRANFNPTRMRVIEKVGEKLIDALNSFCPECNTPGFAISTGLPGLPCSNCKLPTDIVKSVRVSCVKCSHSETKARPDGKTFADPGECPFCNP